MVGQARSLRDLRIMSDADLAREHAFWMAEGGEDDPQDVVTRRGLMRQLVEHESNRRSEAATRSE